MGLALAHPNYILGNVDLSGGESSLQNMGTYMYTSTNVSVLLTVAVQTYES